MSNETREEVQAIMDELRGVQQRIESLPEGNRWGPLIDVTRDITKTTDRLKRFIQISEG